MQALACTAFCMSDMSSLKHLSTHGVSSQLGQVDHAHAAPVTQLGV
jgi:hypothetical protein